MGIDTIAEMYADDYTNGRCTIGGNPGVAAVGCDSEATPVGTISVHEIQKRSGHSTLDSQWKEKLSDREISTVSYVPGLADTSAVMGYNLVSLATEHAALFRSLTSSLY